MILAALAVIIVLLILVVTNDGTRAAAEIQEWTGYIVGGALLAGFAWLAWIALSHGR